MILPEAYIESERKLSANESVKKVMICMGGSDHNNLTFQVLKAIDKSHHDFECGIIVSSSFFSKIIKEFQVKEISHKVNVFFDSDGLYSHYMDADLAITAGGYTHVERMCAGVPGIVINQLVHQASLSKLIMENGATLNLGYYKDLTESTILNSFNTLIKDVALRKCIADKGQRLVDGLGLKRVAQITNHAQII